MQIMLIRGPWAVQRNLGAQGKNQLGGPFPCGHTLLTFLSIVQYLRIGSDNSACMGYKLPFFASYINVQTSVFIPRPQPM